MPWSACHTSDMDDQQPQPKQRSDTGTMLLALLVVAGAGVGALVWQSRQNREAVSASRDRSGFDLAEVEQHQAAGGSYVRPDQKSGLGMVTGAVQGMQVGEQAQQQQSAAAQQPGGEKSKEDKARSFSDLVKAGEAKISALAMAYTKKFPVIQQYGRDWMSYPDLKKLNDDYMRNHDPIAFMKGVAASPNFANLVKKYAGQKPMTDFVMDAVKQAPPGALGQAMDYVNTEDTMKSLVGNVAKNLGIPASLLDTKSDPSKIDQNQVMQSVMGANPDMQKAMQNPEIQKALSQQQQGGGLPPMGQPQK